MLRVGATEGFIKNFHSIWWGVSGRVLTQEARTPNGMSRNVSSRIVNIDVMPLYVLCHLDGKRVQRVVTKLKL